MRRIHQTCILMPMTVKVRLSCLPCLTGMAAALQTRSFGRSGGCALQLVGLRAVSLHFKAHLDRLIIMAALLMLSPLCHHFCSFLLAPSLHPYPFRVSSCCYLNNLQRPCHCLLVLQAVATMLQLILSIIQVKKMGLVFNLPVLIRFTVPHLMWASRKERRAANLLNTTLSILSLLV